MTWVKGNWRWLTLNGLALVVMADLLWQTITVDQFNPNYDLMLISSGKWAIRCLLLCLSMTPLNTLLGWRWAVKLRKPAGLWAFGFAMAHFVLNVIGLGENWLRSPIPDYMAALGVIGLGILTPMAATSSRWAMKRLGKWWKRLHRLIYATGLIVVVHALLESSNKRVAGYEPQVAVEHALYLTILIGLLAVRIPAIRSAVANLKHRPGKARIPA
ncbi:MAG: ferric reductase-like transmembrane domain-containing protein [Chloroflexi bacterium]|nr:ferric reductase-like transmembrane domain-containing protein [Chloroflexota bacterium]